MRPRLTSPHGRTLGFSRRAFLKLGAALGAACLTPARFVSASAGGLSIGSTFPLPWRHRHFPSAEALLDHRLDVFDLLLVPAHAAAELIRRDALQSIPGSPDRAHDPDGAFTIPYLTTVSALVYRGAAPTSLDDLWSRDALWPDSPRLVIGTALLRRGYSANDAHPGRLALVERDLLQRRPRLVPDPMASLQSGLASLALAQIPVHADLTPAFGSPSPVGEVPDRRRGSGRGVRSFIPPEGAILVEYDWAIPLGARNVQAALEFIANTPYAMRNTQYAIRNIAKHSLGTEYATPIPHHLSRLTLLSPLSPRALTRRADIWKRITERY